MTIDILYSTIDKNNFYIGRISQVYRENCVAQVENLSLLSHRKIIDESLIPNTSPTNISSSASYSTDA